MPFFAGSDRINKLKAASCKRLQVSRFVGVSAFFSFFFFLLISVVVFGPEGAP